MKELILIACIVVLILYYVHTSQQESFFVCPGCANMDEISYTTLRNPYYWPFSGTNNISGLVNTMYTGKEITELGGEEVTKDLLGLHSCGVRAATHEGVIQLAHHSEPDHVPLTE